MEYNSYQYLYPPRPATKIAKPMLAFYEKRGWIAQKKKNGTCTVIFAKGDQVIFKTRHCDDHKAWTPQADHVKFFQGRDGWNVYVAELLHSKVSGGPRNELYIFDQLVQDGNYLVGFTFAERQAMLSERFQGEDEEDQYRISEHIALSKGLRTGFLKTFSNLKKEDEGLVIKNPNAKLEHCFKDGSNSVWQVKARIPQTNYSF